MADRWHLLRNLTEAFERLVANRSAAWRAALQAHAGAQHANATASGSRAGSTSSRARTTSAARAGRRPPSPSTSRSTARPSPPTSNATPLPTTAAHDPPPSALGAHHDYLRQRWREGCRNATHLTRELKQRGYRGSKRTVMRYVQHWRHHDDATHDTNPAHGAQRSPPIVTLPSPRKLACNLLQNESDTTTLALLQHVPDAQHYTNLARAGLDAIKQHNPHAHPAWTAAILEQPNSPLRRFVTSLNRDHHAITNALTLTYSNGPTEGNVNRLKLIKRTMYGRAGFELLRKKVLYQSARAPPRRQPHQA